MAGMYEIAKQQISGIFGFGGKKDTKENFIDRDQIADWAENTIKGLNSVLDTVGKEPAAILNDCKEDFENKYRSYKYKEISYWKDYEKSLNSKAAAVESKCFLNSLFEVMKIYVKAIEGIKKEIKFIFPDEMTNIKDIRKSQAACITCISNGVTLCNWSIYMITLILNVVTNDDEDIPKYRLLYISENYKTVIELVNLILQQGSMNFVAYTKMLRDKGVDTRVSNNGIMDKNFFDVPYIGAVPIPVAIVFGIIGILALGRFLRYSQEYLETKNHNEYLRNKEMKEWLEAHVARLRMNLNGTNPNDPQYQKTLKIIDTYDEKIRDLDEEINTYLND